MATKMTICVYLVLAMVALLPYYSYARPVEYENLKDKMPSERFLQILAKQHNKNQPFDKAEKLRDLILASRAYQTSDNEEARQIQSDNNENYSPLEVLQALAEYDTNNDYYQDQTNADGLYGYSEGQEGWFDGPIMPRVSTTDHEDVPIFDNTMSGVQEGTNDEQLNKLLINYLYDHYKMNGDANEEDEDSNVEKRRQKIIIKEDASDSTTPNTPIATTMSTRKAKIVPPKPIKNSRRGQKEVALLRPANASEGKQKEWPKELEENNLDEEDSLKELQTQSRPVRDVLTSQLDGLKEETQYKSKQTDNTN